MVGHPYPVESPAAHASLSSSHPAVPHDLSAPPFLCPLCLIWDTGLYPMLGVWVFDVSPLVFVLFFVLVFPPSTSQNFSGWRRSLEIIQSELSARAGDTRTCPGGFGVFPEKDTPQPPQASYSSNTAKFCLILRWNLLRFS